MKFKKEEERIKRELEHNINIFSNCNNLLIPFL